MEKEYAYIDSQADERWNSEAYVRNWLERVLDASTLEPSARQLINTRSMLPVEFRVFDEFETDDSSPLIVLREEVPLWHILTDRYPWRSFYGKGQPEGNVKASVQMPEFYGALAQELTATRFFLSSIRIAGQRSEDEMLRQDLELPDRAVLKSEVVLLSVWGVSKRLLAEIWFEVTPSERGASKWPKMISGQWPGMHIGVRSGDHFSYSANAAQNSLWLKRFKEPVLDVDIGIYPRWVRKPLPLPGDNIEADQVVDVTINNSPGGSRIRYVIKVPPAFWPRDRWWYYVGIYLSYRCPWLTYGMLNQDGVVRPARDQENSWFFRCDATQMAVDIRLLPFEMAQWTEDFISGRTLPVATKSWQKWDALLAGLGVGELTSSYVKTLIDRSLAKSGLPVATQQDFRVQTAFRYKYQVGHAVYSPHFTAYVPPRYRYFSFNQILVGEPQRIAFLQETVASVQLRNQALSAAEVKALDGLRDSLLSEFFADINNLFNGVEYKQLFSDTCTALARVRVGRFLADDNEKDPVLRECAFAFLHGELKPRLLLFHGKVIPNVYVLKHSSQKALLVSLNMEELTWVTWEPSTAAGQPSDALVAFMAQHLPFPEKTSITRSDFYPRKNRYGYHYRRHPPEPVSFRETADINSALLQVAIDEIKQQMNYVVFSSNEERRRARTQLFRSALRAVAGLVIAAVGTLTGVGGLMLAGAARLLANIGDASTSYWLGQQADRPADYAAYVQECKLGVLLGLVDLGADITLVRRKLRLVLKQSTQAAKTFVPLLTRHSSADLPFKLELESESDLFMGSPEELRELRDRLEKTLREGFNLSALRSALQDSSTSSYVLSKQCADYLQNKSWDIQAIGVLIFAEPHDDRPRGHFALSLRNRGDAAVLDMAMSRLDSEAQGRAYFGSFDSWQEQLRSLLPLQDKLVVCKGYEHLARASYEIDAMFPLGISWGHFFNTGNYRLISLPSRFIPLLESQLSRLWTGVFRQRTPVPALGSSLTEGGPGAFNQEQLLMQVSTLNGLISEPEQILRASIGVSNIGDLRVQLLGFLHAWRAEAMEGYRELMDGVVAEEAGLVRNALLHLDALQVGVDSPIAVTQNAVVDCVDWIATRAGQEDEHWRGLLKTEIERYASGNQASLDLCLRAVLDPLHAALAKGKERQVHHLQHADYEQLSITSGQPLFAIGLEFIRGMQVARQAEGLFALIMTCQPYEDSNELFARIVYGISALRQQRFMVLSPAHERRLSGLETAEPVPL
ncbi:hypothetical protein SAMN04490207_1052 [Pseudomonas gessardii]|uniref:Uncharacterized protein n=1 Tax=Pseudomonas gessardii TaxID=78544 RepID=A0A7Y1QN98_9PSED|nr:hypothetical protein [Pseudomonas gessardii]MRU48740.1 hypothetical protein [Pseudomonas gessardii]NNA96588.1 hypothetical protein [Pseudomonas gessardii]ONH49140.1 hypothetical protein BLL38_00255 [Pseudomonas gessardii]SDQ58736.1 hypothetical protein SAMN04490207_1052 [Pseudomonas gessardii]